MHHSSFEIKYTSFKDAIELSEQDQFLIAETRKLSGTAYAPYSGFKVASIALMENGTLVHGTNQENASYPIGLCAERVMLAAISSVAPHLAVNIICISYSSANQVSDKPIAPCGICRQSLVEFESRFSNNIRLLLTGQSGEVYEFNSVSDLLPMAFKKHNLIS
jgi:cytidine deaminase